MKTDKWGWTSRNIYAQKRTPTKMESDSHSDPDNSNYLKQSEARNRKKCQKTEKYYWTWKRAKWKLFWENFEEKPIPAYFPLTIFPRVGHCSLAGYGRSRVPRSSWRPGQQRVSRTTYPSRIASPLVSRRLRNPPICLRPSSTGDSTVALICSSSVVPPIQNSPAQFHSVSRVDELPHISCPPLFFHDLH